MLLALSLPPRLLISVFFRHLLFNICLLVGLLIFIHPIAQPAQRTQRCTDGRVSIAMFVASATLYYMFTYMHIICTVSSTIRQPSKQPSKYVQSDEFILFSSFHISLTQYIKYQHKMYRHTFTPSNANQTGKTLSFQKQTQQQTLNANCNRRVK